MNEFDDILCHYGTPRHSGRYPWGSGKKAQRSKTLLSRYDDLRAQGMPEKEIARALGFDSTTQLRAATKIANNEARNYKVQMVRKLKEKGMSNVAIGQRLGINESSVRMMLKEGYQEKNSTLNSTADILKEAVDSKGYINVGKGVDKYLGVSEQTKKVAVEMLKQEGYEVINLQVKQLTTGHYTTVQVLAPAGTKYTDVSHNMDKVSLPVDYMVDNGSEIHKLHRPNNIDSSRVYVRYAEDGGTEKDGLIEVRPGVKELDMGNSRYAQVRIGVDGTHYMKGMAVYSDDIPAGYDVIYNSNKVKGSSKDKVFKPQKTDDPDNPFGSSIDRQNDWIDSDGKYHEGALNIVREEGSWGEWKKSLASQVLSKQPIELAKKQLGLATAQKEEEFDEIMNLTNPVVKKKLLVDFADECDKSSVDLKAAALPRQASQVILPITTLKETEIYAPNYKDGEEVVLIRYPHGGIFEIPRLKVNNRNKEADSMIGRDALDAVGINYKVAEQLSGADFDGDSVLVIPTKGVKIKNSAPLEQLKNFDPKAQYPAYEGMQRMGSKYHGPSTDIEMGKISNLITDMSILGAPPEDLARAVRHSMVVIDAEKHNLDYKRSYEENGIAELKEKYRGRKDAGASTLISKAKGEDSVLKRSEQTKIDPETGELIYKPARDAYYTVTTTLKDGTVVTQTKERHTKVTKMSKVADAYELSSGHPMESVYADYANGMKALANKARLESTKVIIPKRDPEAAKVYAFEVSSLTQKLNEAEKNAPRERQAQMIANSLYNAKKEANPGWDADEEKKQRNLALRIGRERAGAQRAEVQITDREWEAMQNNAISPTKQAAILLKADSDRVRQLATPKKDSGLSAAQANLAKAMLESGHTLAEVADHFGVSTSTISAVKK